MAFFTFLFSSIRKIAAVDQKEAQAKNTLRKASAALNKEYPKAWASAKHHRMKFNQERIRPYTSRAANFLFNRLQAKVAFNEAGYKKPGLKPNPDRPKHAISGVRVKLSGLPAAQPKEIGVQRLLTYDKVHVPVPPKLPTPPRTRKS